MKTYQNHFERSIYAIHPPTKSIYRSLSCTWHDDPKISIALDDSWIVAMENTGLHSQDWADDGALTALANKYGVDETWKRLSKREAEGVSTEATPHQSLK